MKPEFLGSPIATPEALARALNVAIQDLKTIAGSASTLYTDFDIEKRDGSPRHVSGPKHVLKVLQKRINRQLFEQVSFPPYLYGGIHTRDYVQNAQAHSGARVIVALDVKDFYPHVKADLVHKIFKNFFCFPDSVAAILTNLCTKDGKLPQGACCSSYLANLAFFQHEPRLTRSLQEQGFKYTRLIDDISVSATKSTSKKAAEKVIEKISAMLLLGGFKLKNKKTKISSDSNPKQLMEITGLWLNRGEPRVKRDERRDIRHEVRKCLIEGKLEKTSEEYHATHSRISGRVAKLSHLNHAEAPRYRKALRLMLPQYAAADVRKTSALVDALCKTHVGSRKSTAYIDRYYRLIFRLNVLGRTEPLLAKTLRERMKKCPPASCREALIHGY